jgi:hypothetical protein
MQRIANPRRRRCFGSPTKTCYVAQMAWSARSQEGFALGATIAGDRAAELATAGLAADAAAELCGVARALAQLPRAERRARVTQLLQRAPLSAVEASASAPPRALSLLAPQATAALARAFQAGAPLPRPGFVAAPSLLALLRSLAEQRPRP